jgi:hypothetical protein
VLLSLGGHRAEEPYPVTRQLLHRLHHTIFFGCYLDTFNSVHAEVGAVGCKARWRTGKHLFVRALPSFGQSGNH